MRYLRSLIVVGSAALLLSLISCSDPTGVGANTGPDSLEGGVPRSEVISPESLRTSTTPRPTGNVITGGVGSQQNWRFLAGAVTDYGRVKADGYLDFSGTGLPNDLVNAPPDSLEAELRLETEYVHGDTASTISFEVSPLTEEADMDDAPSDTTFPSGPPLDIDQVRGEAPTDSLFVLELPASWLRENIVVLQDTTGGGDNFESDFHGFRISSANGDAVVGFDHGTATLRLSQRDGPSSADFSSLKSFSNVERVTPPTGLPEHRLLLQAGVASDLIFQWNAAQLDSIRGRPLNAVDILIPTDPDSASLEERGPSFVRPQATDFRLVGTRADGAPSCGIVATAPRTPDRQDCLIPLIPTSGDNVVRIDQTNGAPLSIFQEALQPDVSSMFSRYRMELTDREGGDVNPGSTLNLGLPSTIPILVPTPSATDLDPPRAELVVTPL